MEQSNVSQEALAAVQAVQLELTGENATSLSLRRPFDPVAHDLDASFRLTRYADLKGWGCKLPQDVLGKLLLSAGLQDDDANIQDHEQSQYLHFPYTRIGIFFLFLAAPCRHLSFYLFIIYILSIFFSLLMNLKLKVLEWMLQSHHFAMEAFHLFKLQISSTLWLMILICKVGYVNM